MSWALLLAALVFLATVAGTRAILPYLIRRAVMDLPNERSSHTVPTPRGGGVAVMACVLLGWLASSLLDASPPHLLLISGLAALLALISWLDDRKGLGPLLRLLVQAACVGLGLYALPPGPVLQGWLPFALDRAFAGLAWLWFLNLYNFMDGIDGITGVETASLGIGIALLSALGGLEGLGLLPPALVLAAASLGFLVWNWHPARIFLGDAGSVPLGFLLGWLLLILAAQGLWAAALILPAYYLADATITLVRRLLKGEKVWQAHRSHFYQKAVQSGWSHAQVSQRILLANAGLIALAAMSLERPWPALGGACLVVLALLYLLSLSQEAP
jgi:UDP-N-acetylmuramyl pentapeptide phosphotransferase/UDP-N-acetylglucosamine-1-phosphate transferase